MEIKRSISFFLESRQNADGKKPLCMYVFYNGRKVYLATPLRIDPALWSKEYEKVHSAGPSKEQRKEASDCNRDLANLEADVQHIFDRYQIMHKRAPTTEELKAGFYLAIGKERAKAEEAERLHLLPVIHYLDLFTMEMGKKNSWSKETHTKFKAIAYHLTAFGRLRRKPVLLNQMDEELMNDYFQYLMDIELRNTTIGKHLAFVRWFLRWAAGKGFYQGTQHNTFKPRLKGSDSREVIYLKWSELVDLYNYQFPESKQYLERVRDVFCFCCFTSLRYSDVKKLRRNDIRVDSITTVTKKTADRLEIELNDYSRAILQKYRFELFPDNLALPVVSNQNMNIYLKEMGKLVGFDEPRRIVYYLGSKRVELVYPLYELLTSHCGRRTFIVNALYLGIPAEVIMKWTGHSDYKAMKPYIAIVDELKQKNMQKFNFPGSATA